jgi:hypothetical protein
MRGYRDKRSIDGGGSVLGGGALCVSWLNVFRRGLIYVVHCWIMASIENHVHTTDAVSRRAIQ